MEAENEPVLRKRFAVAWTSPEPQGSRRVKAAGISVTFSHSRGTRLPTENHRNSLSQACISERKGTEGVLVTTHAAPPNTRLDTMFGQHRGSRASKQAPLYPSFPGPQDTFLLCRDTCGRNPVRQDAMGSSRRWQDMEGLPKCLLLGCPRGRSSHCESKSRGSCLEGELGKWGCGGRGQEARLAHTGG